MNLEFYNCPPPADFSPKMLPQEKPAFLEYRPDFAAMEAVVKEYDTYPNILVIGHGGSVTSFYAFYTALKPFAKKKAYFLSSIDPDYIAEIKAETSPDNTLVLAITKSGENTTQIEALSQFWNYPSVVVTGQGSSVEQVAKKLNLYVVRHPVIGGRFTACTETALLPALFCGLDIDSLLRGAREMYATYAKDNLAFRLASVLWQLEQRGLHFPCSSEQTVYI
jgi:glucose-6-phosphate isomerase